MGIYDHCDTVSQMGIPTLELSGATSPSPSLARRGIQASPPFCGGAQEGVADPSPLPRGRLGGGGRSLPFTKGEAGWGWQGKGVKGEALDEKTIIDQHDRETESQLTL